MLLTTQLMITKSNKTTTYDYSSIYMANPSNITGLVGAGAKTYTHGMTCIHPKAPTAAACFIDNCYPTRVHQQISNGYTYIELLGTIAHNPLGTAVAAQTVLLPEYSPKRATR